MTPNLSGAVWRKSTHRGGNGGAWVDGAVRDSKNPAGPARRVDRAKLTAAAKTGHLDRYCSD